jgi:hypothetical protein
MATNGNRSASALAFCSDKERSYLREIEKLTRVSIRVIPVRSTVSVGAAANRPPETILPRLGQSPRNRLPSAAGPVPYGGRPQITASAERKREPPVRYRLSCSSAYSDYR